jgi:hypothetical protein
MTQKGKIQQATASFHNTEGTPAGGTGCGSIDGYHQQFPTPEQFGNDHLGSQSHSLTVT